MVLNCGPGAVVLHESFSWLTGPGTTKLLQFYKQVNNLPDYRGPQRSEHTSLRAITVARISSVVSKF